MDYGPKAMKIGNFGNIFQPEWANSLRDFYKKKFRVYARPYKVI